MTLLCQVYSSSRQLEMYLYVDAREGLARVPEELMGRFGEPRSALSLVLQAGRRLARADAAQVIEAIQHQGYYLQMPPPPGQDVEKLLDRECGDGGKGDGDP